MNIHHFPNEIDELLDKLNAPTRLRKHLKLVHHTAINLLIQLKKRWPDFYINEELVLFGAATHDIGKTKVKGELVDKGKKHEKNRENNPAKLWISRDESAVYRNAW